MKSAENPSPDLVPIDELDQAIVDLSARINAATYELLVLIREFEDRAGYLKWGLKDAAEWLSYRCDLWFVFNRRVELFKGSCAHSSRWRSHRTGPCGFCVKDNSGTRGRALSGTAFRYGGVDRYCGPCLRKSFTSFQSKSGARYDDSDGRASD